MKSDYMAEVSRLANEYRAMIVQARSIRADNYDLPSEDEARCYKRAVEICSRLATLSVGEARNHWVDCQEMVSRKLQDTCQEAIALKTQKNTVHNTNGTAASGKTASTSAGSAAASASGKGGEKSKSGGRRSTVPQEVVDSWFASKLDYGFEAVAGMEDLIEKLRDCIRNVAVSKLNEHLGMSMVHSFFFYGPPGCGKTFISKAFAFELKKLGYEYMSLSGGDIHNSLVGESEKYVERAFQEAAEREAPTIMFIDEIDSVCRNRSMPNVPAHAMSTTTAFLTGYNEIAHSRKPIIFIGATNYPNLVDNAMMDRVELIKLPLPGLKVRENSFEKKFSAILQNEEGFAYADMADMTDNYNQRDIDRLTDKVKKRIKDEAKKVYGEDEAAAVEAMKDGTFRLTREIFTAAVDSYQPSKKDDIIRSLDEWDDAQQKNQE